jgi:hypothetical protein
VGINVTDAGTATPLGRGFATGTTFPVDPAGAPLAASGTVSNVWNKTTEVIRPEIGTGNCSITTSQACGGPLPACPGGEVCNAFAGIQWAAGNGSEADFTAGSGTAGPALLRSGGWGPGLNRTPGCPGDSTNVDAIGAFPDQGPCNDPLGSVAQPLCAGSDCEGNTGSDDVRTLATIGGVPNIHVLASRGKVPNPTAAAPTLYSVANLTGADLDALNPQDTDFSATVEGMSCPMIGDCSPLAGQQDCIADGDCTAGNTCQNRVARCVNPFVTAPDFDGDTIPDATDSCETIANTGDTDMDGVDNACDTCTGIANPPVAGNPTANRSFISHQRDDDVDGRGNRCDFNYDNSGATIVAGDFNNMKASVGKLMTLSTCGLAPANNQRCGEFDHNDAGATVTADDFNLTKTAVGKLENTAYPKCAACTVGTGWSNVIGPGARAGRPVCQSAVAGACVYAP